jgi:polar amino acid transport system permease protein
MYQFDWSILATKWGWLLLEGFAVTLKLAAVSIVFAFAIGLAVGTLRWGGGRLTSALCRFYVDFARNTPPLVQILFWYFSATFLLPEFAIRWLRDIGFEFGAAVTALSLYHGAFVAEVVRAGLNAIPRGQYDGARALALTGPQMMAYVILPQAGRIALPPLTNEAISLLKNTSLAMAIGVTELAYQTKYIDVYTFRGVEVLTAATVIYLTTCLLLSFVGQVMSQRLSAHLKRSNELATRSD